MRIARNDVDGKIEFLLLNFIINDVSNFTVLLPHNCLLAHIKGEFPACLYRFA
jgi:hypothetical protein